MSEDRLVKHLQQHAVHLEDIVKFFRLLKGKLVRCFLIMGVLCAMLSYIFPVTYQVKALFHDATGGGGFSGGGLAMVLAQAAPKSNFAEFAKSREVLKRAAAKSGLQVSLATMSIPARLIKRLRRNLSNSYDTYVAFHQTPLFSDVDFQGDDGIHFLFKKQGKDEFLISYNGVEKTGKCGEEIDFGTWKATCTHIPHKFSSHWNTFTVMPLDDAIKGLEKKCVITSAKQDPTSITVELSDGLPLRGQQFLNAVMSEYMRFTKEENEHKIIARVQGLDSYKSKIEGRIRSDIDDYILSMQSNIKKTGSLVLKDHVSVLRTRLGQLQKERFQLEHMLRGLNTDSILGLPAKGHLQNTIEGYARLQKERVLHEYNAFSSGEEALATHIPKAMSASSSDKQVVYRQMESIDKQVSNSNFHGLTLESAQKYHISLLHEIQQKQQAIQELSHAQNELKTGVYDLASLELISRHIQIPNKGEMNHGLRLLSSEEFYTAKEKERVLQAKEQQANMLGELIKDKKAILERDVHFLERTMQTLSKTMLSLINKEILFSKQLIKQGVEEEKSSIIAQINQILKGEQEVKSDLHSAVSKWREYHELEGKQELNRAIMEGVTKSITAKSIEKEMNIVDSHPIDWAYFSKEAKRVNRILFGLGGGVSVTFLYGLALFLVGLARGLPLTQSNLKFRGYTVAGSLSRKNKLDLDSLPEPEIDTLRAVSGKLGRFNVLARGKTNSYADALAKLLLMQGKRVLVVTLDSWEIKHGKEKPGLVDYLRGDIDEVPVNIFGGIAYLEAGKNERFLVELLRSQKAQKLFETMNYDHILVDSSAPHIAEEIKTLAAYADVTAINFYDESWCDVEDAVEESNNVLFIENC